MKGIFKILSVGILLLALVGAMYLVRKNQETRKGATAAETSASVLPDKVTIGQGQNFDVHVWLNTGKSTDKLSGAEFLVGYDATKAKYVSSAAQNGYSVLNDVVDDGKGTLTLKMVTLGTEMAGAVDVLKITFQSLNNAGGNITVKQGNLMITGQAATWQVAKNNSSTFAAAGSGPTNVPTTLPKATATVAPRISVSPTPTAVVGLLQCGVKCSSDAVCASGNVCAPIWWPCQTLSIGTQTRLRANPVLDATTVAQLIAACPKFAAILPTTYKTGDTFTIPNYYGVCRNRMCVSSGNCNCTVTTATPTRAPSPTVAISTPRPSVPVPTTPVSSSTVLLQTALKSSTNRVGGIYRGTVNLSINDGSKISGFSLTMKFDPTKLKLNDIAVDIAYTLLRKDVDNTNGKIMISGIFNKPATNMPTSVSVGDFDFTAIAEGSVQFTTDAIAIQQVTGVNARGASVNFGLSSSFGAPTTILPIVPTPIACMKCNNSLSKSKGDANCDAVVDLLDFEFWRSEAFDLGGMTGKISGTWKADFNCDTKADLLDFETWRATVFP